MQYLFDTNTGIALMRQHPIVLRRISAVAPGDCAISTITSYEL
jgi:predicted nucleic acid-binding protein